MTVVTVLVAFVAGLATGALSRPLVFARSVPHGEPIRRTCPSCGADHPPAEIAGWLSAARGRCSACHTKISTSIKVPELLAGTAFAALAASGANGWTGAAEYWLAACGTALTLIDLKVHRLPDALTLPACAGTLLLLTGAALAGEPGGLERALLAAAAVTAAYALLALSGMGAGDLKLAPAVGALLGWTSWTAVAQGTVAGFVLAAGAAVMLMLVGRASWKGRLAFGPYMLLGALIVSALSRQ